MELRLTMDMTKRCGMVYKCGQNWRPLGFVDGDVERKLVCVANKNREQAVTSPLFSADERAVHVVQGLELMEKSKVLRRRIIKARRENGTAVRFFGDFACQDDL